MNNSLMTRLNRIVLPLMLLLTPLLVSSCREIPVGYLQVQDAEFVPSELHVYYHPDPSTPRATNGAPWVSSRIQGVSGTNPINYKFASVQASEGGDEAALRKVVDSGALDVSGGLIRLTQEGARALPMGRYTISLEVFNEGHTALLKDIITIVVAENE